ncbi:MAG: 30S ribosomal protein S2 [Flavobacteriales bacterium]|jgi:small subunit ribosomal protein S2
MSKLKFETLLEAGVHFGHLKRKWNPAMAPYIFEEKKGIHIIDLNKTIVHIEQAAAAMKQIAKSGKKILFVATKKQAKEIVAQRVAKVNMPYVTERWSGGMLTNFQTTRKSIRKMTVIDKMKSDGSWDTLNKREKLFKSRQRDKLEKTFGSIADMTRQPAAIFIVDILKEHIALAEARRLNIPTFAIVDTNSNPKMVDFPIPANDDATKSIALILDVICQAIQDGLEDRKNLKNDSSEDSEEQDVAVAAVETAPVAAETVKETVEEPVAEAPVTESEPVAEVAEEASEETNEEASEETTEEASEEPAEEGSSTEV